MDSRHVLILVEDPQLAELLLDALTGAGHTGVLATAESLLAVLAEQRVDVAIVDLDTRARDGAANVEVLRRCAPGATIVALLPCGGLPGPSTVPYHLALEKPMRLGAVLSAVAICRN